MCACLCKESGRGEQSVFLDEVGLDEVARQVLEEAASKLLPFRTVTSERPLV